MHSGSDYVQPRRHGVEHCREASTALIPAIKGKKKSTIDALKRSFGPWSLSSQRPEATAQLMARIEPGSIFNAH